MNNYCERKMPSERLKTLITSQSSNCLPRLSKMTSQMQATLSNVDWLRNEGSTWWTVRSNSRMSCTVSMGMKKTMALKDTLMMTKLTMTTITMILKKTTGLTITMMTRVSRILPSLRKKWDMIATSMPIISNHIHENHARTRAIPLKNLILTPLDPRLMIVATVATAPAVKALRATHTIMTHMDATVSLLRVVDPDTTILTNDGHRQSKHQIAGDAPLVTRTSC